MDRMKVAGLVAVSLVIAGCEAPQLPSRAPIATPCSSTGSNTCPELTDGAIGSGAAVPSRQPPPPNMVAEELRAGTVRPATDARAGSCGGLFGADPKCGRVQVFVGPLVVTNAYASGGCPDELFLTAGRPDKPHWMLFNPAGASMNVSGQFIVDAGEELFAGVRASAATPKDDVRCTVTWSGFRPLSLPPNVYGTSLGF
jgi:hypothetical protein